jgi:hypothetical protein
MLTRTESDRRIIDDLMIGHRTLDVSRKHGLPDARRADHSQVSRGRYPDATVAQLLGHTNSSTLHKFYARLSHTIEHMKDAAGKAKRMFARMAGQSRVVPSEAT